MILPQRCFPLIAVFLLGVCEIVVAAGTHTDPSGFSITYPDGWVAVDRESVADINNHLPPSLKAWLAKNNVNFDRIAVLLLRDGTDDFLENLNVLVDNTQVPVNEKALREYQDTMARTYREMGMTIDEFQGRVEKVANRDAIVVDWVARMPGVDHVLHQRQFLVPGGGKTYIITCTATVETFDKYQPTFDKMLSSLQAPAPVSTGFSLNRLLITALVGGVAGAIVAAGIALLKKVSGKS